MPDLAWVDIGWVPLLWSRSNWPPYARAVGPGRHRVLLHLMFRSGNASIPGEPSDPDPAVVNADGLLALEASRNYRAFLAIRNVKVFRDRSGSPLYAEFDFFAKTGFTPVRAFGRGKPLFYWKGIEDELDVTPNIEPDNGLKLDFVFPVRLCRKADFANRVVGGRWAPWAWIGVSLIIGERLLAFRYIGSSIPNQSRYFNEQKMSSYNLLTASGDVVTQFFNTEMNRLGPAAPESPRQFTSERPGTTSISI